MNSTQIDKVVWLYENGFATSQIAERFSVSSQVIRSALKKRDVAIDASRQRYDGSGDAIPARNYRSPRTD